MNYARRRMRGPVTICLVMNLDDRGSSLRLQSVFIRGPNSEAYVTDTMRVAGGNGLETCCKFAMQFFSIWTTGAVLSSMLDFRLSLLAYRSSHFALSEEIPVLCDIFLNSEGKLKSLQICEVAVKVGNGYDFHHAFTSRASRKEY